MDDGKREELRTALEDGEAAVNPFTYRDNWTAWEMFKCLLGVAFVPVKLVLATFCLLGMAFFSKLAVIGMDPTRPMGRCRSLLLFPVPWLSRGFLLAFGFYWISVKGRLAKRRLAPVIVAAPHSTFVDSFVICYLIGLFSGLGKKEAAHTPVFGTLFRAGQMIPVDRGTRDGRKKALDEFNRRAHSSEPWNRLLVFPEGTCTNRTSLIQFKRGAFTPGVPVQPIALKWPYRHFDPAWTSSSPSRLKLILRLLTQLYNRCEVTFLPVIEPSEEEKEDPVLFASNVRAVMAEKLGLPTTEHSYESSFLSMAAAKQKFNPDDILSFDFNKVSALMKIDLKEAKRLLRRFGADKKVKKTGKMDVEQFARALKVPLSDPVREMFALLDTDETGEIDFRHFLIGLTFVSQNASPEDGVELLFEALDPEGTGRITLQSLNAVLSKVFRKTDKRSAAKLLAAADPKHTGFVDKAQFADFILANPELLVMGLTIKDTYKAQGRPISVLRKRDLASRPAPKHRSAGSEAAAAAVGPADLASAASDEDEDQDQDQDQDEFTLDIRDTHGEEAERQERPEPEAVPHSL